MKNKKLLTIFFALVFSMVGCTHSSQSGDTSAKKSLLIAGALAHSNGILSPEREACYQAVLVMNQCVGAGSGFDANIMCGASTAFDLTEYQTLIKCASTQVQATYCNFPQNKAADPRVALANYFSSCQQEKGEGGAKIIIASF